MKYNDNGEWKDIQVKVANAIQNEYGESNNDGYSQNYLNEHTINVGVNSTDYRVNFIKGNNLFDENVITNLWSEYGTGNITYVSGANLQRFNCQEGDTFTLKATFNNPDSLSIILIAFYSSNGTLLSRTTQNTTWELTQTAPANTAYMYAGHSTAKPDTIMLNKGSTTSTYEPYIDKVITLDGDTFYNQASQNYSLGEKIIGTWIDGKPLYRKVIDFGALPNNTNKAVNSNISNLSEVIKVYASARRSDKTAVLIPYTLGNESIGIYYGNDNAVHIVTSTDRSAFTCQVIVEYTKTTSTTQNRALSQNNNDGEIVSGQEE